MGRLFSQGENQCKISIMKGKWGKNKKLELFKTSSFPSCQRFLFCSEMGTWKYKCLNISPKTRKGRNTPAGDSHSLSHSAPVSLRFPRSIAPHTEDLTDQIHYFCRQPMPKRHSSSKYPDVGVMAKNIQCISKLAYAITRSLKCGSN